ncbi:dinitrogenase iron-molybdenum cofactor biosynthesis protein, partial [bacterium]|nr:dinitrogenase iron-molybdenum cofactor biosynthesis protein [bacterium]
MSERTVLAVPSNGMGGLDAERSGHFGRCDCFTVVEIEDGAITGVRIVQNLPHVEGGCARPVEILASEGVTSIVVAGIGGRPLAAFNEAGISVYYDNQVPMVGDIVDAMIAATVD